MIGQFLAAYDSIVESVLCPYHTSDWRLWYGH